MGTVHVLLAILKIIGKILLVVLCLLLLILALLLFVPIRYRGSVSTGGDIAKTKDPDGLYVRIEAGYLFKLLYFSFELKQRRVSVRLRAAWKMLVGQREEAYRKREALSDPGQRDKNRDGTEEDTHTQPNIRGLAAGQPREEKAASPAPASAASDKGRPAVGEGAMQEDKKAGAPAKGGSETEPAAGSQSAAQKIRGLWERIKNRIQGYFHWDSVAVWQRLGDLIFAVLDAIDGRIEALEARIDALRERLAGIRPLVDWVSRGYYEWLLHKALKMLRRFRVRHMEGHLRYGTGKPDLTGIAGGALAILLPAGARQVMTEPDFYETALDVQLSFKGHIRLCHAAWLVIQALCRRDTWMMIKRIRGGRK